MKPSQENHHIQMEGPTLLEAARMNSAAYNTLEMVPDLKGWRLMTRVDALGIDLWRHDNGFAYLAIAGTRAVKRDMVDSLKIFLGQTPDARIREVMDFVQEQCGNDIRDGRLAVGGHSLGGLVATSIAAEFHLPALIQNAPGYFKQAPAAERCDRIIEIRTARDVVSDWGSNNGKLITLHDPAAPGWKLSLLHTIDRQNILIAEHDQLATAKLTGATLDSVEINDDTGPTGNTWRSIVASWRRLRAHQRAEAHMVQPGGGVVQCETRLKPGRR